MDLFNIRLSDLFEILGIVKILRYMANIKGILRRFFVRKVKFFSTYKDQQIDPEGLSSLPSTSILERDFILFKHFQNFSFRIWSQ